VEGANPATDRRLHGLSIALFPIGRTTGSSHRMSNPALISQYDWKGELASLQNKASMDVHDSDLPSLSLRQLAYKKADDVLDENHQKSSNFKLRKLSLHLQNEHALNTDSQFYTLFTMQFYNLIVAISLIAAVFAAPVPNPVAEPLP
jgi:hypothetical protein